MNATAASNDSQTAAVNRVDWADYAKGICIILVVMMHSVLGVEAAAGQTGFMHVAVAFATPFRMPDFFLLSGLFLSRVIDRDWRTFLDRRLVHFAYFYVLWVTIQFAFKAPMMAAEDGALHTFGFYLMSFIEPFGTLWFIYLLPVFFIVIKLTRKMPPLIVWVIAAALEMLKIHTGWLVIDEFCARFVYIYSGYIFAEHVFAIARHAQNKPQLAIPALVAWALLNGAAVYSGIWHYPLISLVLGLAGAGAIVTLGALLARIHWLDGLRYCGEHSLVIYLAFFLPMAVTRVALLKTGIITDIGVISALVTIAGVIGPLVIWWVVRGTRLRFLFERPLAFWIAPPKPARALQPAQ